MDDLWDWLRKQNLKIMSYVVESHEPTLWHYVDDLNVNADACQKRSMTELLPSRQDDSDT